MKELGHEFQFEKGLRRSSSSGGLRCGESIKMEADDVATGQVVLFYCNTPDRGKNLYFGCREPSCGVLVDKEAKAEKSEDGFVDPFFFEKGYTLAGKTGWQVWPGSRLMVESLTFPQPTCDSQNLIKNQILISKGARVLELGAGVGVVGASLANAGAQVLLTDLPTLVTYSILPNLERNEATNNIDGASSKAQPPWLQECHPTQIGKGWAGALSLDWTRPLNEQLQERQRNVDIIVACDCLWLLSMLESLFGTVETIFKSTPSPTTFLMSFQRRDPRDDCNNNNMFTSVDRIVKEIKKRCWTLQCLSWNQVSCDGKEENEVFLFEISSS